MALTVSSAVSTRTGSLALREACLAPARHSSRRVSASSCAARATLRVRRRTAYTWWPSAPRRDASSPVLWRRREVVTHTACTHLIVGRVAPPSKPVVNTSMRQSPQGSGLVARPTAPCTARVPHPVRGAQAPARANHGAGSHPHNPRRRHRGAATACPRAAPQCRTAPPPPDRRRAQDRYHTSAHCRRRDSHPTHPRAPRVLRHRGLVALPRRPRRHRPRDARRSPPAGQRPWRVLLCAVPSTARPRDACPASASRPPRPPSPRPRGHRPARGPANPDRPHRAHRTPVRQASAENIRVWDAFGRPRVRAVPPAENRDSLSPTPAE